MTDEQRSWPAAAGEAERAVLLSVARCPLIQVAQRDPGHDCRRVVSTQAGPDGERQVPEAWAGNLRDARLVFVSSNPSISLPAPGGPADAVEPYPVASDSDAYIAEFLGRRFDPAVRPLPYVRDNRSLLRNGQYAGPTKFWSEIRKRAGELLDDADPARNFAMTEVVHCKSRNNTGAAHAARTCAPRYLHEIMALTSAPIVIVVGKVARETIRRLFPRLPHPPEILPLADLGGRDRIVLFTGQPGSNEPRIIRDLYAPVLDHLRAAARPTTATS